MYPSDLQLHCGCDFVKRVVVSNYHLLVATALETHSQFDLRNLISSGRWTDPKAKTEAQRARSKAPSHSRPSRTEDDIAKHARPSHIIEIPSQTDALETSMFRITKLQGQQVPAFALTGSVTSSLKRFFSAEWIWGSVKDLSQKQLAPLRKEIDHLNDQITDMASRKPSGEGSQEYRDWHRSIEALRLQRWKKIDERRALIAFRKTFWDTEVDPHCMDPNIRDKMTRSRMLRLHKSKSDTEQLKVCLSETIEKQEALPWPCSDSEDAPTSTTYTLSSMASGSDPEVLKYNLAKARKRVKQRDGDPLRKLSRLPIENEVARLRRAGIAYPPSTIVDQYGVTKMTAWNQQMDRNKRRYKCLKRRMRQKGIPINRELSDDSEFSWDVKEDFLPSEPSSSSQRKRRRKSRRWKKKLPLDSQSISDEASQNASANHPLSHLSSLRIGSNLTKYPNLNRKCLKRQNMWARYERDRTREKLNGRSRVMEPPKRMRAMHRRLAGYAAQMPNHFRLTNGARRHVGGRGARHDQELTRDSSHGDFEFWDRPRDLSDTEKEQAVLVARAMPARE